MSRYDGLIIPRSYSEYINKTDAATLSQALALPGVMDAAPTESSNKAARSGGIYSAINAVKPVDTVALNNMHSVTSNAVSRAMSYSTSEVNTGKKWIDGKPIYRKVLNINGYPATIQTGLTSANEVVGMVCKNTVGGSDDNFVFGGILTNNNVYYPWAYQLSSDNTTLSRITSTYSGIVKFIILEYTKTTD
jgi:hypothetical protein